MEAGGGGAAEVERAASVLFQHDKLDPPDELELEWRGYFDEVCRLTAPVRGSADEVIRVLVDAASVSDQKHTEVVTGLVFGCLADSASYDTTYQYLRGVERDNGETSIGCLRKICREKCVKLLYSTMGKIMTMVGSAAAAGIRHAPGALIDLVRLLRGGDVSDGNIWACNAVLTLLQAQWTCVNTDDDLVTVAFYGFLRLAADHRDNAGLQTNELDFCLRLWESAPRVCARAGRDMVRALQDVARHPAAAEIWRSLLSVHGPVSLDEVLLIQCPRIVLTSRLTPRAERQLMFLMTEVRRETCGRHQKWFTSLHLATPARDSLICDLIRVISSDVVPRYLVLNWLLGSIITGHGAQNAKLALFIDWFVYKRDSGNIMYIEPGILLIKHAVATNIKVASTLLEFLCLITKSYLHTPGQGQRQHANPNLVRDGISAAIVDAKRLGVFKSTSSIFLSAELDLTLIAQVGETFGLAEASHGRGAAAVAPPAHAPTPASTLPPASLIVGSTNQNAWQTSDSSAPAPAPTPTTVPEIFAKEVAELRSAEGEFGRAHATRKLLQRWCDMPSGGVSSTSGQQDNGIDYSDAVEFVAKAISPCVSTSLREVGARCDVVCSHNSLFELAAKTSAWDLAPNAFAQTDRRLLELMAYMMLDLEKLGFFFLAYLQFHSAPSVVTTAQKVELIRAYCALAACFAGKLDQVPDEKILAACLLRDLRIGESEDLDALYVMFCFVYTHFPRAVVGNADILRCFVTSMDAKQLYGVHGQILLGLADVYLSEADETSPHAAAVAATMLKNTLSWETFEQLCVWELCATELSIRADEAGRNLLASFLPHLTEAASHPEAAMGLTRILMTARRVGLEHYCLLFAAAGRLGFATSVAVLQVWAAKHPGTNHIFTLFDALLFYCRCEGGQEEMSTQKPTKMDTTAESRSWRGSGRYWVRCILNPVHDRPLLFETSASVCDRDPLSEIEMYWRIKHDDVARTTIWNTLTAQLRFLRLVTTQGKLVRLDALLYRSQLQETVVKAVVSHPMCPGTWKDWLGEIFGEEVDGDSAAAASATSHVRAPAAEGSKISDKEGPISFNAAKERLKKYTSSSTDFTKFSNFATKCLNLKMPPKDLRALFSWWKQWSFGGGASTAAKAKRSTTSTAGNSAKRRREGARGGN